MLEGENMVGCRRCWKISQGLCPPLNDEDDEDDNDSKNGSQPSTADGQAGFLEPPLLSNGFSASPASLSAISSGPDMNVSTLDLTSSVSSLPPSFGTSHDTESISIPAITTIPPHTPSPTAGLDETKPSSVRVQSGAINPIESNNSLRAPDMQYGRKRHRALSDESVSGASSDESSEEQSDTSMTSASQTPPLDTSRRNSSHKRRKSKEVIMRRSYKRYLVSKPPPVLVIHLKRFQQIAKSPMAIFGNLKKLDDYVPFPEFLDLSGYLAPRPSDFNLGKKNAAKLPPLPEDACMYRLVAIVVHIGNMVRQTLTHSGA